MSSRDQFSAGKTLTEFVASYVRLIEFQLNGIRGAMERTVNEVMEQVQEIDRCTELQKQKADEMLLHRSETVERISMKEYEAEEARNSPENADTLVTGNRMRRIAGKFSKQLEALGSIESQLGQIVFQMMGTLSTDDVIKQRLSHVILAIRNLSKMLAELLSDADDKLTPMAVNAATTQLLEETYQSYTMEEEKLCFHGVFGKPQHPQKAS